MKDILFIINPASARGATLRGWGDARRKIVALGIDFDERFTSRPAQATEITRDAVNKGVKRVIAVGGDGTLSEVVNGYMDENGQAINKAAALGLIPSGTGSDFGRSLSLSRQDDWIRALTESETRLIDAGRAEFRDLEGKPTARTFINVASFGLGGDVSELVNRWRGSLPRLVGGRARFAAAALAALGRYRNIPVSLRIDGREISIRSNLIIVANGRFAGGGMMLAPHAELEDGLLDVIVTDQATRWDVIKELPRIQRGAYLNHPKVTEQRAAEVSIVTEEKMSVDLDGEMVGFAPARIRVLPQAIRMCMPGSAGVSPA
ncbi:MAG TPA: diacylglycerol kinase family protein [Blastocatellia bacterium]|nr:diacylglycerol kinase family protein [Blastocatellia bacterium]